MNIPLGFVLKLCHMTLFLLSLGLVLLVSFGAACWQEFEDFRDERCPSVAVDEGDWRSKSWEFAQARIKFEVERFSKLDEAFGEKLSRAFDFRLRISESKAVFIPTD
jgi:hypothetical protein